MRKVIKYFFLGLVLLLVFLSSALLAMRFAIQGREVSVPRLTGLTPAEAERKAQMLMERLRSGTKFSELAMDYSEDPSTAPQGGDLGFVPASALNQVPPPLRAAVLGSQPGNVKLVSVGGAHTLVLLVERETAGQRTSTKRSDRLGALLSPRRALHCANVT